MHKQGEILEEILAETHIKTPDSGVLSDLLYTASESGIINVFCDFEDIEVIAKIYNMAIEYGNVVPEELRM